MGKPNIALFARPEVTLWTVWRHIMHLTMMEEVTLFTSPLAFYFMNKIDDRRFNVINRAFNVLSLVIIFHLWQTGTWFRCSQIVLILGITKQILIRRKSHCHRVRPTYRNPQTCLHGGQCEKRNVPWPTVAGEPVAEIYAGNRKPSLDWLNLLIQLVWLNFRALVSFIFLTKIWPDVQADPFNPVGDFIKVYDFQLGNQPIRIDSIECKARSNHELIFDIACAYDGNASVVFTLVSESVNIAIPATLEKFNLSNVKIRIVLKHLMPRVPFIGGTQVFFLESPNIGWMPGDAAKITDLPGLESLIKSIIDQQVIRRFVYPNRLCTVISNRILVEKLRPTVPFKLAIIEESRIAMPVPSGIIRVLVKRAEGLKPTDMADEDNAEAITLNKVDMNQLFPTMHTPAPFVRCILGTLVFQSETCQEGTLEPVFNYECEFPVEYHHTQEMHFEIYAEEYKYMGGVKSDEFLGRTSERIDRVVRRHVIEGWYNMENFKGRVLIHFQWIPLLAVPPPEFAPNGMRHSKSGVLCLLLGTLTSKYICKATCHLQMALGDGRLDKRMSLESMEVTDKWAFNEGKVYRLRDMDLKVAYLEIKVWDSWSNNWMGEKKFNVARLIDNSIESETFVFSNPFNLRPPISLSLSTKVMYDWIPHSSVTKPEAKSQLLPPPI